MKEHILVNINYDYTKKQLICLISDIGIGIKQEDQDKIFNLHKTKFNNNLTFDQIGMGLLISKQLVQSFGGSLDFVSRSQEPHRGTTIVFTFELDFFGTEKEEMHESRCSSQLMNLEAINLEINSQKPLNQYAKQAARSFPSEFGDDLDEISRSPIPISQRKLDQHNSLRNPYDKKTQQ